MMIKNRFHIGVLSHCGYNKKINQDRILVKVGEIMQKEFGLFAVADGLGGHQSGELASTIAIYELSKWWDEQLENLMRIQDNIWVNISSSMNELFNKMNYTIYKRAQEKNTKMGTTLTVLFIYNNTYFTMHLGDSRLYINDNKRLIQMTEDHSRVAELVKSGKITQMEARTHPQRNFITKCLGVNDFIKAYEKIGCISKQKMFLLCSDGLYNYINTSKLNSIICQGFEKNIQPQTIVNLIFDEVKHNGAGDNVSIILIKYY